MWLPFLLLGLFQPLLAYEIDWKKVEKMARGKLEILMPENHEYVHGSKKGAIFPSALRNQVIHSQVPSKVKAFINEDLNLYHNLEMKHIPGADPELVLYSSTYEELERIPLHDMKRSEINELVTKLGFFKKKAPVPPYPQNSRWHLQKLTQI